MKCPHKQARGDNGKEPKLYRWLNGDKNWIVRSSDITALNWHLSFYSVSMGQEICDMDFKVVKESPDLLLSDSQM